MYVRDKLLALGMRRPALILDESFDVPVLDIGDFDVCPYSDTAVRTTGDLPCEVLVNTEAQRALAVMFIQKTKLCRCMSRALKAQYCTSNHTIVDDTSDLTRATTMLVPKKLTPAIISALRKCDRELELWCAHLPSEAQYYPSEKESGEVHNNLVLSNILHFHRALLRLLYLATTSALHRPQVFDSNQSNLSSSFSTTDSSASSSSASSESMSQQRYSSRTKVRKAAIEITEIAQNLQEHDLARYLPMAGVTIIVPAVIIHLLALRNTDNAVRETNLQRFWQCMNVLQAMRDIYAPAELATVFLKEAIKKTGIEIPSKIPSLRLPISPVTLNGMTMSDSNTASSATTDETISPITPDIKMQSHDDWPHLPTPESSFSNEDTTERPSFRFPGFGAESTSGFYPFDPVGPEEYPCHPFGPNIADVSTSLYAAPPAFPTTSDKITGGVSDSTGQQSMDLVTENAPSVVPQLPPTSFDLPYHGGIPKRASLESANSADANSVLTDPAIRGSYDPKPTTDRATSSGVLNGLDMPAVSAVPSLTSFGLSSISGIYAESDFAATDVSGLSVSFTLFPPFFCREVKG